MNKEILDALIRLADLRSEHDKSVSREAQGLSRSDGYEAKKLDEEARIYEEKLSIKRNDLLILANYLNSIIKKKSEILVKNHEDALEKKYNFDLQRKEMDHQREIETLKEESERLASLEKNVNIAYENYKKLSDRLIDEREENIASIKKIDKQLSEAGINMTDEKKGWLSTFVAIAMAVILAIVLLICIYNIGGNKPTSNILITYDLAKMVEAFLLGAGALIAGVAYAFSVLRKKFD